VIVPVVAGARREALSYTVPAAGLAAIDPQNPAILPAARLTNYVFAHSKYSSTLGQRNVLSGLIGEQPDAEPAASVVTAAGAPPLQP
jgi:hypothetical protein